jgi:hypothetical protein
MNGITAGEITRVHFRKWPAIDAASTMEIAFMVVGLCRAIELNWVVVVRFRFGFSITLGSVWIVGDSRLIDWLKEF